jgi:hydrogenase expression/formation protein HypE
MDADQHITLAHGNGGRFMRELIEECIARQLREVIMDVHADAVVLPWQHTGAELLFTTDGFTVKPLEFPGGNIGSLAVHGTVNDLAVSGATPCYLSLNLFIEEGLPLAVLERILAGVQQAALEAKIKIACGDTKVLPRGECNGMYLATSGIGHKPSALQLGLPYIRHGDAILVSGPVGDHGIAVMLAREQFGLRGQVHSDAASVLPLTLALRDLPGLRFMRDPTRGGLATVLQEMHRASGMGIRVDAANIPLRDSVQMVCDMLGYDPLYLACEGRVVAVVEATRAAEVLRRWRSLPQGELSAIIGHLDAKLSRVILQTALGGERVLEELEDDPLPRIC